MTAPPTYVFDVELPGPTTSPAPGPVATYTVELDAATVEETAAPQVTAEYVVSLEAPPPGSVGGGDGALVRTQQTPAAQWSWPNPTGRLLSVALYTLDGEMVDADVTCSETLVVVTFASPTAGRAVLT